MPDCGMTGNDASSLFIRRIKHCNQFDRDASSLRRCAHTQKTQQRKIGQDLFPVKGHDHTNGWS
ncbi:hypothetical protein D9M68_928520 [compost metagenome]